MSRSHRIYIDRAHVFEDDITWTTVAGLYPHAYVPEEEYVAAIARAERAEAALAIAEKALRGAIATIDAAYDGPGDNGAYAVRERAALAKIEALKGGE